MTLGELATSSADDPGTETRGNAYAAVPRAGLNTGDYVTATELARVALAACETAAAILAPQIGRQPHRPPQP